MRPAFEGGLNYPESASTPASGHTQTGDP